MPAYHIVVLPETTELMISNKKLLLYAGSASGQDEANPVF